VRSYTKMAFTVLVPCGIFLAVLAASVADERQAAGPGAENDQSGGNSKCHVCHPTLKAEEITTGHLAAGVTCDECHGTSTEHMHDEMLMTPPDLLFGRAEVNAMCSNRSCHAPGEGRVEYALQDHKDPAKVRQFHEQWLGRVRPNGRAISQRPICTDCHGTHNLDEPLLKNSDEQAGEWAALFNGTDLTGWQASDPSAWTIRRGSLIGSLESAKIADLWTQTSFGDYLLAVTFRAEWPIRAGVWLRYTPAAPGARVEIGDIEEPPAFTGSIRLSGKGLALANLRSDLTDREGWNTLSVRVEGRRVQVWLNSEEIGAVLTEGPNEGRIGIHLEARAGTHATELQVREIQVKTLAKPESASAPAP
jgi:hypothetical protein